MYSREQLCQALDKHGLRYLVDELRISITTGTENVFEPNQKVVSLRTGYGRTLGEVYTVTKKAGNYLFVVGSTGGILYYKFIPESWVKPRIDPRPEWL